MGPRGYAVQFIGWMGICAVLAAVCARVTTFSTADTRTWSETSRWLKPCVLEQRPQACRKLSKFPIWNHLLALSIGGEPEPWRRANVAGFAIYLCLLAGILRAWPIPLRLLLLSGALFSPFFFYANSSFTEVQQGLLLTLGALGVAEKKWWLAAVFVPLSIASKETLTACWVVVAVGLLASSLRDGSPPGRAASWKALWREWTFRALVFGTAVGGLVTVGLNRARYRRWVNVAYLGENVEFGLGPEQVLLNAFWSLFSPNGGLLISYGLLILMAVGLHSWRKRTFQLSAPDWRERRVLVASAVLLFGVASTSAWWAAFGWDGWGHRLLVPYAMAFLALAVPRGQAGPNEDLRPEPSGERAGASRGALLALALAGVGSLYYNSITMRALFLPEERIVRKSLYSQPACQRMVHDERGIGPLYWDCAFERFTYIP